ncbi:ankyrin repeat protein [Novosphingobium sp. PhB165]|uniref:ankyrin repeat domain-containing protein n=1 Tax=Novosphingobium sp. PhB165 TaxID=2485105 RepID=UPI0010DEF9E1|nr:ankyrin repeat domain-containing protein [Novosphingobium sp. PhB165]TCM18020.1 ankyrin repeat protein [Novosphingobium sp. PhB165]
MSNTVSGNVSRLSRRILASGLAALAAGMMIASPAHADYSEGYKFLESVKKKEGDKVEKQLMDNSQIVNAKDVTTGETALHVVTQRRDATWLNFLIGKGANVNLADDHGRTPLELAVNLGWREGVEILLDAKASTESSNDAGETPLIFAVHRKDVDMVKALLQAGANADRADNSGRSARDYANVEGGKGSQLAQVVEQYGVKGGKAKAVYGPVL